MKSWPRQASRRCWSKTEDRDPLWGQTRLGTWLSFFAKVLGRMSPNEHVWILTDGVPAFVRFEGPLYTTGPVWRIELTSPHWPN